MNRRIPPNLGLKLMATWLIISGIIPLVNLQFAGLGVIMSILAVVAGVLIIIER